MSIFMKEPPETFMEAISAGLQMFHISSCFTRKIDPSEFLSRSLYTFQGHDLYLTLPDVLFDNRTQSSLPYRLPIPPDFAKRLVAAGRREGLSLPSVLEYAGTRRGNVLAEAVEILSATAAFGLSALVLGSNARQHISDLNDQPFTAPEACMAVASSDGSQICASDKSQTNSPAVVTRHPDGRIDFMGLGETSLKMRSFRPTIEADRWVWQTYVKPFQDEGSARYIKAKDVMTDPRALVALSQYVSVNGCPGMTPEKLKTQFEKLSPYAEALTSDKASDAILRAVVNNPGKVCAL